MEKRALLAAVVAGLFLIVWYGFIAPPPPKPTEAPTPPPSTAEENVAGEHAVPAATDPRQASPVQSVPAEPAGPVEPAVSGTAGETRQLTGGRWHAVVASDGGVVRSLVLDEFKDSAGEPLDLVAHHPALLLDREGPWNQEPYAIEGDEGGLQLRWSDGQGSWVEKNLQVSPGGYGFEVEVTAGGEAAGAGVVVASSLADHTSESGRFGRSGGIVEIAGDVKREAPGKLEASKSFGGGVGFIGVEDQYFLLVLLPEDGVDDARFVPAGDGALDVVVAPRGTRLTGSVFAGPKQHDVLVGYGRGLEATLSFGVFGFFSVMFLHVLRWIHTFVGNWGVAIIVLTAAIRVLLFPLTHKSTVAMRRMQQLKPKMDAIQGRYKERAKKDPTVRAKMNQEIMGLYKQEGVNPMGGCLPTLVQLPILWALYTLFAYAIELRQAPFALWIHDLSLKDPTYVLPILMTVSMFLQQKLAPQAGDPAQRRMFLMMPLIFGVMFMSFPAGLVLYWLTNNVLTIGQQLITDRLLSKQQAARS